MTSLNQASVADTIKYVRNLKLNGFTFNDYADILEKERINGKVFLALTLDGFNSIGIIDYPRRKLFYNHIKLLNSQNNIQLHVNNQIETIAMNINKSQNPSKKEMLNHKLEFPQLQHIQYQIPTIQTTLPLLFDLNNLPNNAIMKDINNNKKRQFLSINQNLDNQKQISEPSLKKRKIVNQSTKQNDDCIIDKHNVKNKNKNKNKTRYTYRRWTDQEENSMRKLIIDNNTESRIDWVGIQKNSMPYRTICGIKQHWDLMQRRDRAKFKDAISKMPKLIPDLDTQ